MGGEFRGVVLLIALFHRVFQFTADLTLLDSRRPSRRDAADRGEYKLLGSRLIALPQAPCYSGVIILLPT